MGRVHQLTETRDRACHLMRFKLKRMPEGLSRYPSPPDEPSGPVPRPSHPPSPEEGVEGAETFNFGCAWLSGLIGIALVTVIGGVGLLLLTTNGTILWLASGPIPWLIVAAWLAAGVLGAVYFIRRHVIQLRLRGDQMEVVTASGTRVGPVTDVTVVRARLQRSGWVVDIRFQHRTWSMVGGSWGLFNDNPRDAADALEAANPRLKRVGPYW